MVIALKTKNNNKKINLDKKMINKTKQHLIRTLCFATMLTTLASCADDEGTETSNNEKV